MNTPYLEITYRRGNPIAAYLYLPRQHQEKSHHTQKADSNILIDYNSDNQPIGIELTAPKHTTLDDINHVLAQLNIPKLTQQDMTPLLAA